MKFKTLDQKSIPELEQDVHEFWKKEEIFKKSVEQRPDNNLFRFFDGPPFISGLPHYGHLLVSIAKDVIPRFWTMKGKRVDRVWGWDAHGLTVENKVQKELGIKDRKDIESFGLEKFTEACYDYTSRVSGEWQWYIDKIGRWADMENAYKTIDQSYMESVIWAFKQLYDKGLIYEGVRTSLYCTSCGTPVSNFEVSMDNTYREESDPAVTVKFEIESSGDFKGAYVLAWTTTPWTLPSNRALVLDPTAEYVVVKVKDERLVFAKERQEYVLDEVSDYNYKVLSTIKGKELLGLKYKPLYTFYSSNENAFKIYEHEGMVNMIEGTGIVHSAPGFGDVDTQMGQDNNLTIMLKLDDEGNFLDGDSNEDNPFTGQFYKDTNVKIIEDLEKRNLLFKNQTISHRVPYHDRCDTTLVHRAQNSWFVDVQSQKSDLYKNNEPINWIPERLKYNRFQKGIEQAPDWCISRSRFWATPMPVWESDDGDRIVVGSITELEELSGQKVKDLHRPYIDDIEIVKNGKTYKRLKFVLDSWFEAGSMPYAQLHYPFENEDKFKQSFPGDYIVEYIPQTRAWFYVMHVLSNSIFGTNSFKNAIGTGTLAGDDGRKMSKTYGNFTDPEEVLTKYGGDALRMFFISSPLMVGGNANFDVKEVKTKLNNVLNPLLNSLKFFLIYAEQTGFDTKKIEKSANELDTWILIRLNQTIKAIDTNLTHYQMPSAGEALESFADDLSRWYVRRSRERIAQGDMEALSTLYTCLKQITLASAPLIPFMAETLYRSLSDPSSDPISVHLCDFPSFDDVLIDEGKELVEKMQRTREVVSLALGQRTQEGLKVRQPLLGLEIVVSEKIELENFVSVDLIKEEVNIKHVSLSVETKRDTKQDHQTTDKDVNFASIVSVTLDTNITPELEIEGQARELVRKVQDLRKKQKLTVDQEITVYVIDSELNKKAVKQYQDYIKEKVNAVEIDFSEDYKIVTV